MLLLPAVCWCSVSVLVFCECVVVACRVLVFCECVGVL